MSAAKKLIIENLDFLNEQQLQEVADFSSYLKVRSKIQNFNIKYQENYRHFASEDKEISEFGMEDYNNLLLIEDKL